MKIHPEYDALDLTDSKVTNMQQPVGIQYKGDDVQFLTLVFMGIILELVGYLLGDIDDMKIFKIKYLAREWAERKHYLRYFK